MKLKVLYVDIYYWLMEVSFISEFPALCNKKNEHCMNRVMHIVHLEERIVLGSCT
jgi:hypothetical protein